MYVWIYVLGDTFIPAFFRERSEFFYVCNKIVMICGGQFVSRGYGVLCRLRHGEKTWPYNNTVI